MTTHELAHKLLQLPNVHCLVSGYEMGLNEIDAQSPRLTYVNRIHTQPHYCGQYEEPFKQEPKGDHEVVVIER